MAGISGQPTPNPKDLKSPVPSPTPDPYSQLDQMEAGSDPYASLDALEAKASAPPEEQDQSMMESAVEYLPAAGGIAGSIAGSMAGGVGAIPGAALGGAAGQSLKRLIEINFLNKGTENTQAQELKDVGVTGAIEGASQLVGAGMAKIGGKVAMSKFGQKIGGMVADAAETPLRYVKAAADEAREKIQKPVLEFLASKGTKLTGEQAGDAAKNLLKENIKGKYGPFIQAYADLDQVSKALPIQDVTRYKFTEGLKAQAMDLSSDSQKVVRSFAEKFNAADNGAKFSQEIGALQDVIDGAYKNGATNLATALKEVKTKAVGYLEGETTKLAARVSAGKATPQEMQFLSQVMQKRGIQDDPVKYAKSLAKDYLTSKDKIAKEYSAFRSFLEDVGEQVKVKPKHGPMSFIDAIDDVPSEKLIEKMFDPKNAAALRRMQKETPEVFEQVTKSKITQLMQKASPDGNLDLAAFRKEVLKLPPSTRSLLMGPDDLKMLNKVVDNPRLKSLDSLENSGTNTVVKLIGNILEASRTVGAKAAKDAANSPTVRQLGGKGVIKGGEGLYQMMKPEQEQK